MTSNGDPKGALSGNGGKMIGGYSEEFLHSRAEEIVLAMMKKSTIFDADAEQRTPKFDRDEITLGRILGRGGFCTVSEIKIVDTGGRGRILLHSLRD